MIDVRNIVLTRRSREALSREADNCIFDTVADQVECADWSVPGDTTEFSEIRDILARSIREFFSLGEDVPVEIKRFDTSILSFHSGIYPDYSDPEEDDVGHQD